jgi:hypothetical protein
LIRRCAESEGLEEARCVLKAEAEGWSVLKAARKGSVLIYCR